MNGLKNQKTEGIWASYFLEYLLMSVLAFLEGRFISGTISCAVLMRFLRVPSPLELSRLLRCLPACLCTSRSSRMTYDDNVSDGEAFPT